MTTWGSGVVPYVSLILCLSSGIQDEQDHSVGAHRAQYSPMWCNGIFRESGCQLDKSLVYWTVDSPLSYQPSYFHYQLSHAFVSVLCVTSSLFPQTLHFPPCSHSLIHLLLPPVFSSKSITQLFPPVSSPPSLIIPTTSLYPICLSYGSLHTGYASIFVTCFWLSLVIFTLFSLKTWPLNRCTCQPPTRKDLFSTFESTAEKLL